MVVAFHAVGGMEAQGYSLPSPLNRFAALGSAGVDIFFVISGFVIYLSVRGKDMLPTAFLRNRLIRIVPAYWVMTLLAAIATVTAGAIGIESSLAEITVPWLIQSLTFSSHLGGNLFPILYQGWSLEYEMIFYVTMAFALCFAGSWSRIVIPILLVSTVTVILGLSPRAIEFLCGLTLAALLHKRNIPVFWGKVSGFISLIIFACFPHPRDLLAWCIASVALVFAASTLMQVKGRFWSRMGSASYPIYLVQWFSVPAALLFFQKTHLGATAIFLTAVVAIVGTTVIGFIFDWLVDTPIRNLLRKTFGAN